MSWNYRIVEDNHGGLGIYEVYYDDAGVATSWSSDPVWPYGDTMQELNTDFNLMQDAFYEPVLKWVEDGEELRLDEHLVYTKRTEVK